MYWFLPCLTFNALYTLECVYSLRFMQIIKMILDQIARLLDYKVRKEESCLACFKEAS